MFTAFSRSHSSVADLENVLTRINRCAVYQAVYSTQLCNDFVKRCVGSLLPGDVPRGDCYLDPLGREQLLSLHQQLLIAVDETNSCRTSLGHQPSCFQAKPGCTTYDHHSLRLHEHLRD